MTLKLDRRFYRWGEEIWEIARGIDFGETFLRLVSSFKF
jgi:hypothetical protein